MRQRNGQRASAVRCIFGPPEKRAHLMMIMRNEAEMERKRIEFAARYEPVGLSPNERRNFYDGLVKSSPTSNRHYQQQNNGKSQANLLADICAGKILFVKIFARNFFTPPHPSSSLIPSRLAAAADVHRITKCPTVRFRAHFCHSTPPSIQKRSLHYIAIDARPQPIPRG